MPLHASSPMRRLSARTIMASLAAGRRYVDRDDRYVLDSPRKARPGTIASLSVGTTMMPCAPWAMRLRIVGDLLAGIAVGIGHRQGLEPGRLGGRHREVDLDRLEGVGEEADRVPHGEGLHVGGRRIPRWRPSAAATDAPTASAPSPSRRALLADLPAFPVASCFREPSSARPLAGSHGLDHA